MDAKEAAKKFELGPDGNIITCPLLGYTIAPVAETAILARIEYAENLDQVRAGGMAVQLVMTPPQALEIAAILTKQANHILGQRVPDEKN